MIEPYRSRFNASYTEAQYGTLIAELNRKTRTDISFRICETPCFFDRALLDEMAATGLELTHRLLDDPAYLQAADAAIPSAYRVANCDASPNFMTVDFGLVRAADGSLRPTLVELQAFPSIFGYQDVLSRQYMETYDLDRSLTWYFGDLDRQSYWALLRQVIVGRHDPGNVVLLEVTPERQKTLPDFHVYEDELGIRTVDITQVVQRGKRLFYRRDGRETPIHRIFNRAIADEMEREGVRPSFDLQAELDVEWAGHPNWYFGISKFSLPFLEHRAVPKAVFVEDWLRDPARLALPPGQMLLKPLYSFAGKGIQFDPTRAMVESIPAAERRSYLLQERVEFEPVVETPFGRTQVEVRVMYLRPDEAAEFTPVMSLARLGRGRMMGVDHNRDQSWVGGSVALFPKL